MAKGDKLYAKALKIASVKNPNNKLAFDMLQRAIALNNNKAMYAIATWYLFGKYVEENLNTAVEYLIKASEQGNSNATYDLAVCYEQGKGVIENLNEAFKLYTKAALLGDKQSIYEVGRCYYYGIGINANKEIAEVWLEIAENHGIE
jgi:TPR repeat protein